MKKYLLFVSIFTLSTIFCKAEDTKLLYKRPAKEWVEALPLGNSRLGAMVFGNPAREQLQLNEETMWGGGPHRNDSPNMLKVLDEVRSLIFAGKEKGAEALLEKNMRTPHNGMPYQTIGSLYLDFAGHNKYSNYSRQLDLATAVATTKYTVDDINYTREVFSSFTDNVIIMRITADKPNSISFTAGYDSPVKDYKVQAKGDKLILKGMGAEHE